MAYCALILASGSPRRKELLGLFDLPFVVQPADIDESQKIGENSREYVRRLAHEKGIVIAKKSNLPVLSADTIVEFEAQILGKPVDRLDAERILTLLRGRTHLVYTAISLIDHTLGIHLERLVKSEVLMREYSDYELQSYLDSGNWHDKAGGYAIQDSQFQPCASYFGSYTNIMGLPVKEVAEMLKEAGFAIGEDLPERLENSLRISTPKRTKVIDETIA